MILQLALKAFVDTKFYIRLRETVDLVEGMRDVVHYSSLHFVLNISNGKSRSIHTHTHTPTDLWRVHSYLTKSTNSSK